VHTFAQVWARPLLVLHAVSAALLVAASTHHLVWASAYLRGRFVRVRAERLMAGIAAAAYTSTFMLGLILYPNYKLHVRAEYFDQPESGLGAVAHLFDMKEMWVLVGVGVAGGLFALSRLCHPRQEPRATSLYVGLSVLQCVSVWGALLAGLYVASFRAVAP
jgi:hypothetical protein